MVIFEKRMKGKFPNKERKTQEKEHLPVEDSLSQQNSSFPFFSLLNINSIQFLMQI